MKLLLAFAGLALLVIGGCQKAEEPETVREVITQPTQAPAPQLTYRERKARGLLTPEELREELALQKIEEDTAAGRIDYYPAPPPRPVPDEYITPAPVQRPAATARTTRVASEREIYWALVNAEDRFGISRMEEARDWVCKKYGITRSQLEAIAVKALMNNWPLPPPPGIPAEEWY